MSRVSSANSLRDLALIREANRKLLDRLDGPWGTAFGRKGADGPPAVLVFVNRKIHEKWLDNKKQLVPKTLKGPMGLVCPTDVLQVGGDLGEPYSPGRLSGEQLRLRNSLRGERDRIGPGSQLAFQDLEGTEYVGTLGAFARRREDGAIGLITNAHVGSFEGNLLSHPDLRSEVVARVSRTVRAVSAAKRYDGIIQDPNARVMMDCAFAEIVGLKASEDLEFRVPWIDSYEGTETIQLETIGDIKPIELDDPSLWPIGESVYGAGRTRSDQRGVVKAYAYQSADGPHVSTYTDLLIASENEEDYFSHAGDSGKMIFTNDESRPIALLWGA